MEQVASFADFLLGPSSVLPSVHNEAMSGTKANTPIKLILYEPIRPDDPFGRIIVSNLATHEASNFKLCTNILL